MEDFAVLASRMDEYGRPAWIAAVVLSFIVWWPLGVAMLAYLRFSGRLQEWRMERIESRGRWRAPWARSAQGLNRGGFSYSPPSGNRAFDEYRADTLRRLEEEQKEFVEYLDRLRQARDKAEFDQFMADRRTRREPTEA